MDANLDGRSFKIISLTGENSPIGVNYTKPAWQSVYVNGPVQQWVIRKVGDHKYRLSIDGYPYTGVLDGKVIASIYPEHEAEWKITHHEYQNAYTLALAKEPHLGWTIPLNIDDASQIEIGPIISTPSIPPQFLPRQLFRFVPVEE